MACKNCIHDSDKNPQVWTANDSASLYANILGVYVTPETFNPSTYEPTLEATTRHGYVELMAKKLAADSLNVYWRPAGTATSAMLSAKRARFPFHDGTSASAGQTMRAREYMATVVIANECIGNQSNIASVVFQR